MARESVFLTLGGYAHIMGVDDSFRGIQRCHGQPWKRTPTLQGTCELEGITEAMFFRWEHKPEPIPALLGGGGSWVTQ